MQPGFSVGGPIIKNKTFFFVSGEMQLAIAGESILDTSPSAAWVSAGDAVLSRYSIPVNPVSMNLLTIYPAEARGEAHYFLALNRGMRNRVLRGV